MKDTVESVALEFANNAIEGLTMCELGGIPAGMEESVRETLDGVVAVPAAELERLREIERRARLLMGALDSPNRIGVHGRQNALRAALGAK